MPDENKRANSYLPNPAKVPRKTVTVPLKVLERPEIQLSIEVEEKEKGQ